MEKPWRWSLNTQSPRSTRLGWGGVKQHGAGKDRVINWMWGRCGEASGCFERDNITHTFRHLVSRNVSRGQSIRERTGSRRWSGFWFEQMGHSVPRFRSWEMLASWNSQRCEPAKIKHTGRIRVASSIMAESCKQAKWGTKDWARSSRPMHGRCNQDSHFKNMQWHGRNAHTESETSGYKSVFSMKVHIHWGEMKYISHNKYKTVYIWGYTYNF